MTAATVAVFIALVLLARAALGASGHGEVVSLWNRLCASEAARVEAMQSLNDSLHARHPDRVTDARRLELYTHAILESERQAALLRAMRKSEFGRAGEDKGEGSENESPRNRVPALPGVDVAF